MRLPPEGSPEAYVARGAHGTRRIRPRRSEACIKGVPVPIFWTSWVKCSNVVVVSLNVTVALVAYRILFEHVFPLHVSAAWKRLHKNADLHQV
jgi:hypothetical protein